MADCQRRQRPGAARIGVWIYQLRIGKQNNMVRDRVGWL